MSFLPADFYRKQGFKTKDNALKFLQLCPDLASLLDQHSVSFDLSKQSLLDSCHLVFDSFSSQKLSFQSTIERDIESSKKHSRDLKKISSQKQLLVSQVDDDDFISLQSKLPDLFPLPLPPDFIDVLSLLHHKFYSVSKLTRKSDIDIRSKISSLKTITDSHVSTLLLVNQHLDQLFSLLSDDSD